MCAYIHKQTGEFDSFLLFLSGVFLQIRDTKGLVQKRGVYRYKQHMANVEHEHAVHVRDM